METIQGIHGQLSSKFLRIMKNKHLYRFFLAVGSYHLLKFAYNQIHDLVPKQKRNLIERYGEGSWAVVTGGSDGIGKEFCLQLAKEGFNICIISRTMSKMDDVCKECFRQYGVKTKYIVADFQYGTKVEFFQDLAQQLSGIDVSILVNNVGVSGTSGPFQKQSLKEIFDVVTINATSTIMMTRALFERLLARPKRSAVISISSAFGKITTPYCALYSATKAFQDNFTKSMANTYHDMDFMVVQPLGVQTGMLANTVGPNIISPEECVKAALDDFKKGLVHTHTSEKHKKICQKFNWSPEFMKHKIQTKMGRWALTLS